MTSAAITQTNSTPEDVQDGPGATLYAVYCTAQLSLELLAEFILQSRHDYFPVIVASKDSHLKDYATSTRLPLTALEFPFIGWSLEDTAAKFEEQVEGIESGRYGTGNFVILDERTARDKTCLIVNMDGHRVQTLRSDFDMALDCFVGPEIMAWGFDEFQLAPFYHGKITVTRARYEVADGGERGAYSPSEIIQRNKHLVA